MKKSKFINNTIILIIGGFMTKVLGMIIKIISTRLMGTQGIGLYMLIMPTFMLFITLATLGLPTAISKLVAEDRRNNRNLVFSSFPIIFIINLIIMFIIIIFAKLIANTLLHEPRTYYAILSIGFVLPFISISSVLRGYFFGKQRMLPHVISNTIEDITRLISIILFMPFFVKKGLEFSVAFLVISNIVSELTSILILFFFLPKHFKLAKKDIIPSFNNIKQIMDISLPTTGSRLIGSIGLFFEPIILTFILIKIGYSNTFIINEYGVLNGYVMPLILLPSFFSGAISQALLPIISKSYASNHKKYIITKIKQAIFFSLLIGLPATIIFTLVPQIPLHLIYNTDEGINYIKVLAPICLLHYIQAPLTVTLQAIGKASIAMKGTFFGMIIRTLALIIGCFSHIGLWGLVIASSLNIIYITIHHYYWVKKLVC
ncbi:MAG: polysaccharide biosynthesis protein [Bacilli bacterium]